MKKRCVSAVAVAAVAALAAGLWTAGCEDENGGGPALSVTPSTATMGRNISSLTITVVGGTRELSLPLTWTMDKPELGQFVGTSGMYAEYMRNTASGANTIVVKDQYGAEGVTVVYQVSYNTADPNTSAGSVFTNAATTNTATGTSTRTDTSRASVSVSGYTITVNGVFFDGSLGTVNTESAIGTTSWNSSITSASGERHTLVFSNATWGATGIQGFTMTIDGGTTVTYP